MSEVTRQLAAIMFSDIVGYTSIMNQDEDFAFQILKKNKELHTTVISQCNGILQKELGDGILASFPTVYDAILCAVELQKRTTDSDLSLRIGIHLGDVVFEDDDIYGDGVNIASRIQQKSNPGETFISESVYRAVSNKKEIFTEFVKEAELKNVKEKVKIYKIRDDKLDKARNKAKRNKLQKKVILYSSIVLFIGAFLVIIKYIPKPIY